MKRTRTGSGDREDGQIGLLILGLAVVVLTLVVGIVDVTAVQLARVRVYDAADAAAVDAADALAEERAYRTGVAAGLPLTDAGVHAQAARFLAATQRPEHVTAWAIEAASATGDGHAATVTLTATIEVPLADALIASALGPVTVTVAATAEGRLDGAAPAP